MNGPESTFYFWLTMQFPEWHFQRIETSTGAGIPDCHVRAYDPTTHLGYSFWVELKAIPKHTRYLLLRKEQLAWIMRRATMKENVWVWRRNGTGKDATISAYPPHMFLRNKFTQRPLKKEIFIDFDSYFPHASPFKPKIFVDYMKFIASKGKVLL